MIIFILISALSDQAKAACTSPELCQRLEKIEIQTAKSPNAGVQAEPSIRDDKTPLRITEKVGAAIDQVKISDAPGIGAVWNIPLTQIPTELDKILAKINAVVFPDGKGAQIRFGKINGMFFEPNRKFIVIDPEWLDEFRKDKNPNVLAWAIAHEISHYVETYHRKVTGKKIFEKESIPGLEFPGRTSDNLMNHVQVDAVAAEVMKRAGFSNRDISAAARANDQILRSLHTKENGWFGSRLLYPTTFTDFRNRLRAVDHWISENPDNDAPFGQPAPIKRN